MNVFHLFQGLLIINSQGADPGILIWGVQPTPGRVVREAFPLKILKHETA